MKCRFLFTLCLLVTALGVRAGTVEFKGWHYPAATSCAAAKAEFEAKYKTYGYLITECKKQNPNAQLGGILSFSCFMGDGKNGFSSGAVITATVGCDPQCVPPPSVCPAGKVKIGDFVSPTGAGWGKGTYAACLEGPQKVTLQWCSAAFYPGSDHKCDDYKGYSTVTPFGGKKYCLYNRTNSQYYKALEIEPDAITVSLAGLHYPNINDCNVAKAQYSATFQNDVRLQNLCKAKNPATKPVSILSIECKPANPGTYVSVTVKCQ